MRERAEAGRELPIEVTRAQLTAARIEQRIAQMEDREDSLSGELRDMMGLPAGPADRGFDGGYSRRRRGRSEGLGLASDGEQRRAEAGRDEKRRAREEKLKGERGGYWPTISLIGQYNVLSNGSTTTPIFSTNFNGITSFSAWKFESRFLRRAHRPRSRSHRRT